jgi:hypothetical protein
MLKKLLRSKRGPDTILVSGNVSKCFPEHCIGSCIHISRIRVYGEVALCKRRASDGRTP